LGAGLHFKKSRPRSNWPDIALTSQQRTETCFGNFIPYAWKIAERLRHNQSRIFGNTRQARIVRVKLTGVCVLLYCGTTWVSYVWPNSGIFEIAHH